MSKLLDISEIKGSTHTIYRPTKRESKSDLKNLQTRWKNAKKKYWKVETELPIDDNTKIPQIYTLPQFLSMSEKIVEFTDSTHIIYWPEYVIYRPDFHNLQTRKIWDGTNNKNRTFHK